MSDRSASFLDGLRNPEYTGENRCIPCTIVNTLIAVALSLLVYVGTRDLGGTAAVLLAVAVFGVCVLAIYVRGYLVPGTPEITERYLPERVLAFFGTHPIEERQSTEIVDDAGADGSADPTFETVRKVRRRRERSVDPVDFLREADVIEPDDDDHQLTAAFADRARERILAYRDREVETTAVGDIFGADPDDIAERDREYPAYEIGVRIRKWPSKGALIADVATHEVLGEYVDRWDEVPPEQRADILEWLRGLGNACPVCDGEIAFSDGVIESCCGRFEVTTIACTDCGERLREFDPVKVGNREDLKGITP